ncbi:retinoschisin-like [Montipora foliosa]|uniref:retinoschisin-like n=1 Tax=Montipora foliosa TaxID=591990 RepID=UPI0035F18225
MQSSVPIFLTLLLIFAGCMTGSKIRYEVNTYTGNKFGAGTDARVFITLIGEKGRSKEIELESKGRNDFEKGQKDTFFIETKDLGKLTAIKIRHDDSWFGSGWFLERVKIKSADGCVYEFPNHKWLASTYGDKMIARKLVGRSRCRNVESPSTGCRDILGVSSGLIKDIQLTASSSYDEHHQPYHARLNKTVEGSRGGWCSAFADEMEFLEINLGNRTNISGISTQGQSMFDNWVTMYELSYSLNGKHWFMVKDKMKNGGGTRNFTGNKDMNTVVTHWFPTITAQHLRVLPMKWSGLTNCMRIELYGCRNGE